MKKFEFIFTKTNGKWKYTNFIRQSGRPINVQKYDIYQLLNDGIDKLILVEANDYLKKNPNINNLWACFFQDEISFYNLELGYYTQLENSI